VGGAPYVVPRLSSAFFLLLCKAARAVLSGECEQVLKEENVDIVYDTMGGPGVWDHALQVLKKDGTFVTIAGDGGEAVMIACLPACLPACLRCCNTLITNKTITPKQLTVGRLLSIGATIMNRKFWSVFGSPRFHLITTSPNWTDLFDLRKLFDENHALRPVVERVYPLQQARAAFEEHMKGRTRGKIVIQVRSISAPCFINTPILTPLFF